jgi:hypothetical protein
MGRSRCLFSSAGRKGRKSSNAFWYARLPPGMRAKDSQKAGSYFNRKGVTQITDDIILAYGRKP